MARLLLHATVPHASCVCPSHHVASPWPPEACASGGGFAVGGFLWKPSSVFGFWIVCHCLMTRPTPLRRLQPSTTTIMIVVAALLRTAQCTSSPSSPVPPPPELRHPLLDHLQGPAPPARLTSDEANLALHLQWGSEKRSSPSMWWLTGVHVRLVDCTNPSLRGAGRAWLRKRDTMRVVRSECRRTTKAAWGIGWRCERSD